MRSKLFAFALALVTLMIAMPAQARGRRHHWYEYSFPYSYSLYPEPWEQVLNYNLSIPGRILSGTYPDTSYRYYEPYGYGFRRPDPAKCVDKTLKAYRKAGQYPPAPEQVMAMCTGQEIPASRDDDFRRFEPVAQQQEQPQPQPTSFIVTNRTGDCILLNGQRLEHNRAMEVADPSRMRAATLWRKSCNFQRIETGRETIDLVCR